MRDILFNVYGEDTHHCPITGKCKTDLKKAVAGHVLLDVGMKQGYDLEEFHDWSLFIHQGFDDGLVMKPDGDMQLKKRGRAGVEGIYLEGITNFWYCPKRQELFTPETWKSLELKEMVTPHQFIVGGRELYEIYFAIQGKMDMAIDRFTKVLKGLGHSEEDSKRAAKGYAKELVAAGSIKASTPIEKIDIWWRGALRHLKKMKEEEAYGQTRTDGDY